MDATGASLRRPTIPHSCPGTRPFPLSHGWLKKAFDAVASTSEGSREGNRQVFCGA